MKKLLIFFAIVTLTNLNAQEKQNDATWEETIGFIKKYKNNFSPDSKYDIFTNYKFDIYSDRIVEYYEFNDEYRKERSKYKNIIYLSKLMKVEDKLKEDLDIIVRTTGNDVFITEERSYYHPQEKRWIYIETKKRSRSYDLLYVPNREMYPRLLKAFKQLAYLATKKREEKRKQSGDKF